MFHSKHVDDVFQPDIDDSEGVTSEGESQLMFITHYVSFTLTASHSSCFLYSRRQSLISF